nr:hypothetical protein [Tanacetum cinerariifolium]
MVAEDDEMSKDKEIDKLMALISLSFKKIYKPTNNNLQTSSNTSRENQDNSPRINRGAGYDNQRLGNVAGAKETVGTVVVQKSRIQCYNCKEFRHVARECQKPKRTKDATYHKEKMLFYKQEEAGIQLNAEQGDWRDDTNNESEDQELEAHYMYMAQIQKVSPDAADSRPIFDAEPLQKIDQNDDDNDLANERELHASLIKKLKCEIDDSKNRNKFLETSNKVLVDKLKGEIEDFKNKNKSLESSNNHFKEANNKLPETNVLLYKDLIKFQAELDRRNDVEYTSKVEIDCAKAKGDLISYKMESQKSFNKYTQQINDLNQTISEIKMKLSVDQETISLLSQTKEAHIKLYKTREDKELDKVIALENKVKVLKAQKANPRLYDIGCYNDNLALMLAPESDEVILLEKESRSKLSDLIRPFDYDKLNNIYDLFVPQREKLSEQRYFSERSRTSHTPVNNGNSKESFNKQTTLLEKRMDESIPWDQKCKSSKELFKIKRSVGTIFDGVKRYKEIIAKRTYFGQIDPFIQNTIEANFCLEIQKINADLKKFHACLKEEMVADLRYFNSLELEVDSLKCQLETQKTQFLNEIDRLSKEYYYVDHMNAIIGVYTELDEVTNLQCDYELLEKCECLEKELSKSKTMSKSFEAIQKHAINLEIDLQRCQEKITNDKSFKENQSKEFHKEREQYFEIQDLKAQLQDKGIAISELKKLIEKLKGKSVDTKFEKSSVMRQPNAFKRVIPTTSVSRPQLKSNQMEDRVLLNNSQGKKHEVEDHRRNVKFSKNKTFVTACNDSLKAKTSNINFVCTTCGKCVLNEKHDMCLLKYVNGVNSRTKMPIAVPGSTREPKRTIEQSVAKPLRKTVALETRYNWKPKSEIGNVEPNLVKIILFIVDSKCSKHMTGNLKLLINFVEKFLGMVKFRNDQIAPILGYGDLVQGAVMIKRVYYVEGLNHNLFSVGQFCDADLEVAFRKSTCYIHDLKGNNLLAGSRGTYLLVQRGLHAQVIIVRTDKGTEFLNKTLHAYFAAEGITHQTSISRTPKQNSVVERRNRPLVEVARTMLSAAKVPLFFWAEAIATSCFTQNRSLEKGDKCIFIGYSTQSRAYRVFNKRTRVIVETIHVNFDELPQMASDHISSDPIPQCQRVELEHDSLSPGPQCQEDVPKVDRTLTTSNELYFLFSLMFAELLNRSSQVVSKSSAETTPDASNQQIIEENAQVENDEFINIFCTPVQDRGETSSRHVDSSNMHTFYQHHPSEHRWIKDHPLEQVIRNPSQSVRTRR